MSSGHNAVDHNLLPESTRRPGLSERRVLAALGMGTALSLLADSTLYTVLPDPGIASQVGLSAVLVGVALGLNRLVRLFSNNLAARLLEHLQRRSVLIVAALIGVASACLYAVAQGPFWFLFGRVLWGLAWSGIWVGSHAAILDLAPEGSRGRLNGAYQAWFFGGAASTAFVGGALVDLIGFRATMWLGSAAMLVTVGIWAAYLPANPRGPTDRAPDSLARHSPGPFPWMATLGASLPYFAVRLAVPGILASTTIIWLGQLLRPSSPLITFGLPLATLTGAFVAMRTVVSLLGAPASGWLSDRLQKRWGVITLSMSCGAGGLWLMGSQSLWIAAAGALLAAVASGAVHSLAPALIGDHPETAHRNRALGLLFTLGDLGSAIGPSLALGGLALFSLSTIYEGAAILFAAVAVVSLRPLLLEDRLPAHPLG